jgi:hypothetical protein
VRQRRPSENVNEHKDTRSFDLREDIKVSLELSLGFAADRKAKIENGKSENKSRQGCPSEGLRASRRYKYGPKTETLRLKPGALFYRDIVPQQLCGGS